jgi:hypothetical protein
VTRAPRPRLGAAALVLAVATAAGVHWVIPGAPAGAAAAPGLLACSGRAVQKPASFVITCADAYTTLTHIRWTSWGPSAASATATFGQNPCTPNCASSSIHYYPHAAVRLSRPVHTSHGILYSDMSVRYVRAGKSRTFTFTWKGDPGFKELRATSHLASS